MRASKELANEAMGALKRVTNAMPPSEMMGRAGDVKRLEKFIEAAAKALPTQVAIDRDRIRKKDKPRLRHKHRKPG